MKVIDVWWQFLNLSLRSSLTTTITSRSLLGLASGCDVIRVCNKLITYLEVDIERYVIREVDEVVI